MKKAIIFFASIVCFCVYGYSDDCDDNDSDHPKSAQEREIDRAIDNYDIWIDLDRPDWWYK
jgi:hypothetical protein